MKVSPGLARWLQKRIESNLREMGFGEDVLRAVKLALEHEALCTIAVVGECDANGDVFTLEALEGIAASDEYVLVNGRLLGKM